MKGRSSSRSSDRASYPRQNCLLLHVTTLHRVSSPTCHATIRLPACPSSRHWNAARERWCEPIEPARRRVGGPVAQRSSVAGGVGHGGRSRATRLELTRPGRVTPGWGLWGIHVVGAVRARLGTCARSIVSLLSPVALAWPRGFGTLIARKFRSPQGL
jgi:hypothetical protein